MGSEGPQDRGLEITKCPNCCERAPLEDAEIVVYTAAQRWDELLEVAQEWAKIDTHRAVSETSEEEEEEDFINDKSTDATYVHDMLHRTFADLKISIALHHRKTHLVPSLKP